MLDINMIREEPELVRAAFRSRQMDPAPVDSILRLDEARRTVLTQAEKLKAERNLASKEIGRTTDTSARESRIEAMRRVGDQIAGLDAQVAELDAQLFELAAGVPNIPDARTPIGKGDDDDVLLHSVGEPKTFDFNPKPHWDLGPALGMIDFERGQRSRAHDSMS